jgi:hypothetical protein
MRWLMLAAILFLATGCNEAAIRARAQVEAGQEALKGPCVNVAFRITDYVFMTCPDPRQHIVVNREGPLTGRRNDDEDRTDVVLCICPTPTVAP